MKPSGPEPPSGENASQPAHQRAGAAYSNLIEETLVEERARRLAVERRGTQVVTSSVAIAGIVVALLGLSSRGLESSGDPETLLLSIGVFALGLSACIGLSVNWPLVYDEVDPAELRRLLEPQYWDAIGSVGERRSAEVRIDVLTTARAQNRRKAIILIAGLAVEVVGVAILVSALALVAVPGR